MNWAGLQTYSLKHLMPKDSEADSGDLKEKSSDSRFLNPY